jgi:dihydroflavonol-4-reductase
MTPQIVLVSGGSGFIAGHCIAQLLEQGFHVTTTVRSLDREPAVRASLAEAGVDAGDALRFVAADLTKDEGWAEAAAGATFVLHVASPFPLEIPDHEDDLIIPARDGALRVLRAARDAGVQRVVLTSSFAAVGYGHPRTSRLFTEEDWTDVNGPGVTPYVKSKTLAEQAAWRFVEDEGGGLELATINPVGVFGPVLGKDFASSVEIVRRIVDGALPGYPNLSLQAVDVRDVASAHLLAMTNPAAKGQRFLATADGVFTMKELGGVLKSNLGDAGKRVPTRSIPNIGVRIAALFDKPLRQIVPELGDVKEASNAKAREVLGWTPRTKEDAVVATAESLVRLGLVKS